MKKRGIGSHTKPNCGENELWLTPKSVIWSLGRFDLDPCACPEPRPWPTATRHIALPEDGLASEWEGRVFLNPPYGDKIGPWMEKMSKHNYGIALIFARTETDIWQRWIWPFASAILFPAGRFTFYLPDGTEAASNSGGPSALISYGEHEADVLERCGVKGWMVRRPFTMTPTG